MMQEIDRKYRLARLWSNEQLRLIAPLCRGVVANVSAGEDVDKQGATYRDYFSAADEYWLTNHGVGEYRGYSGIQNEILLDLTETLPEDLVHRFDVVLNHTTLEHVFDVNTAFRNLCSMTNDLAIVVVPFCQLQHETAGYDDFWRFTPTCLRRLFDLQDMTVVYEAANNDFNAATYLIFVASRNPDRWQHQLPAWSPVAEAASWAGDPDTVWYDGLQWRGASHVSWRQILALVRHKFRQ